MDGKERERYKFSLMDKG